MSLAIHRHNQEAVQHFINNPHNLNLSHYILPNNNNNNNLSNLLSSNLLALTNKVLLVEDMDLLKELLLTWLLPCSSNSNKYHNLLLLPLESTLRCHPLT